jgi:hypothetical protein
MNSTVRGTNHKEHEEHEEHEEEIIGGRKKKRKEERKSNLSLFLPFFYH